MTSSFDGPSIGRRVESLRKLNGWSRDVLAARTGERVRRDVIANIEGGRKKELTVPQWIALSEALSVPPLALLVDIRDMSVSTGIDIVDETGSLRTLTNVGLIRWVSGTMPLDTEPEESLPSRALATEVLSAVHEMEFRSDQYARAVARYGALATSGKTGSKAELDVIRSEIRANELLREEARRRLRALGVKLNEGGGDGPSTDSAE